MQGLPIPSRPNKGKRVSPVGQPLVNAARRVPGFRHPPTGANGSSPRFWSWWNKPGGVRPPAAGAEGSARTGVLPPLEPECFRPGDVRRFVEAPADNRATRSSICSSGWETSAPRERPRLAPNGDHPRRAGGRGLARGTGIPSALGSHCRCRRSTERGGGHGDSGTQGGEGGPDAPTQRRIPNYRHAGLLHADCGCRQARLVGAVVVLGLPERLKEAPHRLATELRELAKDQDAVMGECSRMSLEGAGAQSRHWITHAEIARWERLAPYGPLPLAGRSRSIHRGRPSRP
jgi:hypothetical protein